MKIAERNVIVAEIEKAEEDNKRQERENRESYLDSLRKSEDFQKYVVSEILEKELHKVGSIDAIPESMDFEGIGKALLVAKAAKKLIENMLKPLRG